MPDFLSVGAVAFVLRRTPLGLALRAAGENPAAVEALRLRPDRLVVISKGKVIAEKTRNDARLDLPGRPATVRRRHRAA